RGLFEMKSLERPLLLATLLLMTAFQTSAAQPGDDPFSEANQAPAKPKDNNPPRKRETVQDRITFEAVVEPKEAKPGETVRLTIKGMPKPSFHTYPLTQRASGQEESGLSKITADTVPGLRLLGPVAESEPEPVDEQALGVQLEHAKPFT